MGHSKHTQASTLLCVVLELTPGTHVGWEVPETHVHGILAEVGIQVDELLLCVQVHIINT